MKQHHIFELDSRTGYFKNNGVDIMAFMDIYPAGHQSGVSMIMHGNRIATNGDGSRFRSNLTGLSMKRAIPLPRNYAIPMRIST